MINKNNSHRDDINGIRRKLESKIIFKTSLQMVSCTADYIPKKSHDFILKIRVLIVAMVFRSLLKNNVHFNYF